LENQTCDVATCRRRWIESLAPETHDLRAELVRQAAEYFQLSEDEVARLATGAVARFADEWRARAVNPKDPESVVRFYNETKTDIFELLEWHATNDIHARSVVCADLALRLAPGNRVLDYGSGIGSDAIVFARHGFNVTLADVSEPKLAFAAWRGRRHGFEFNAIDLKREMPERAAFDAVVCFDVLEHIPEPVTAVRVIRDALRPGGLLFLHAPFGEDPARPMHVAHADTVTPWMRTLGFHYRWDLESAFPRGLWAPRVFQRTTPSRLDRFGYYLQDVLLPEGVGQRLAALYRMIRRRRS
jgi:2-polyprenyl-3-methyl-5-hydroxy-6-metoxy-1,4-benzoquinol methylase